MSTSTVTQPTTDKPAGLLRGMPALAQPSLIVLIGLLLLRTIGLFAGQALLFAVARLIDPQTAWGDVLLWSNVTIVVIDVITLAVVAWILRRSGSSLRAMLRTATPGRDIAWGLLVTVIIVVGFLVATFVGNLAAYQGAPPVSGATAHVPLWFGLWCLLVMPVTIALAEEVLYRGYLQTVLSARWGRLAGLLVMATAFGLQHLALTAPDPQAWLARFITTFLAGIMFGLLLWWMKRLWPLIIGHWALDVLGLGLPVLLLSLGAGA